MFKKFLLSESADLSYPVEIEKKYQVFIGKLATYLMDDRAKVAKRIAGGHTGLEKALKATDVDKLMALTRVERPRGTAPGAYESVLKKWG